MYDVKFIYKDTHNECITQAIQVSWFDSDQTLFLDVLVNNKITSDKFTLEKGDVAYVMNAAGKTLSTYRGV